jgi:diguanylate cyclase (GGDEF)-like protein
MSRSALVQRGYVLAVALAGACLTAVFVVREEHFGLTDPVVLVLALLVLVGEANLITVHRRGSMQAVIFSTTFIFALLLYAGLGTALVVGVAASVVVDAFNRFPWDRIVFNAGQYSLAVVAAGTVLWGMGHSPGTLSSPGSQPGELGAVFAAGAAMFLVNHVLVGIVVALTQWSPLVSVLTKDLGFHLLSSGVLIALAPVVVVIAAHSLALVPVLLLIGLAVHRGTRAAVERAHAVTHDALTGLGNRTLLKERVDGDIGDASAGAQFALLMLDIDRFREINDTLGHDTGDKVLAEAALRIQAVLPDGGVLARVGGDEFVAYVPDTNRNNAQAIANTIRGAFTETMVVDGFPLDVPVSIGIALYPEHGEDAEVLIQRADVALYIAKEGQTGAEMYRPERDQHSHRRLSLVNDLRRALEDRQLFVQYQPKVDALSGEAVGVEALVRWRHPEHGLVPPDEFVPLAERTGLIQPLTDQVLELAVMQCALWRRAGFEFSVAVNLSAQNLHQPGLMDSVQRLLHRYSVQPEHLTLEITESTVMAEPEEAMRLLGDFNAMGVRLTIDDFGTGYSSLAYLRQLPVQEVKIDRSFVRDIATNPDDATIVRAIVYLAKNLGLEVVAEGVEDNESWTLLTRLGCDRVQGYGIARPLDPQDLTLWLFDQLAAPASDGTRRAVVPPPLVDAPVRDVVTPITRARKPS